MTVQVFQYFLIITAWSLMCSLVQADSLREYHQRKCSDGKQESCQKAEAMLQGEHLAERIVELGDHFATTVNRLQREEDNKPILKNAYIDVLDDYFKSSTRNGKGKIINNEIITLCAEHYHDYWRNRKMWWPTDEAGKPDWSTIYYYIVDHYYGYCLALSDL
ncbi:uncharacterized protein METZ01_LOCUS201882 [marine metagenome]|uniref:Uncharacterized protein n=1 Tax=marine metagenome TaxID=408172 RepID=A0A382EE83_9ZZZZ